MGNTQRLGNLVNGLYTDASGNVGVGASPSGSYKFDVTGTGRFTDNISLTGSTAKVIGGDSAGRMVVANSTQTTYGIFYGATNATPNIITFVNNSALTLTLNANNTATFSSSVSATKVILSGGSDQSELTNSVNNDFKLTNSGNFRIINNSNTVALLTITNAGAATFSNNITLGGNTLTSTGATGFTLKTTTSGAWTALYGDTGGLYLGTNAGNWMFINNSGNVGIGTTSPSNKLHVYGSSTVFAGVLVENSNSNAYSLYQSKTANSSLWQWGTWNDNSYRTGISGVGDFITITSGGIIQIPYTYSNTTAAAANVQIDNNGYLARSTSSLKYKNSVENYDKGLNIVNQLRPVYYKGNNDGDTIFAGLIAEDIHDLGLTEFVQYAEDGTPDALAYQNMIALAFKAIQELSAENQELNDRLNKLENK